MAHAEMTVVINRPVESVFNFVLNGANNPLWRGLILDARPLSREPYGVGSKFEQGLKGPNGKIEGDYEITECKLNEWIQFDVTTGLARPTGTYRFERQGRATALTFVLDYQIDKLSKQVDPAVTQQMFQEVRRAVKEEDTAILAHLSRQENQVFLKVSEGKTNQEIGRSLYLGEGTIRNYVFSIQSKLMDAMIQRSLQEDVGMLEQLKALLEKQA